MIFFTTCGRGFQKFVKEELEKDVGAKTVVSIDDGKIIFCVCRKILQESDSVDGNGFAKRICKDCKDSKFSTGTTKERYKCSREDSKLTSLCGESKGKDCQTSISSENGNIGEINRLQDSCHCDELQKLGELSDNQMDNCRHYDELKSLDELSGNHMDYCRHYDELLKLRELSDNHMDSCRHCEELQKLKELSNMDLYKQNLSKFHNFRWNLFNIMNLKLVERVFILLDYKCGPFQPEEFSDLSLVSIFKSLYLEDSMKIMEMIKTSYIRPKWKMCSDPANCYAFESREHDKSRFRRKKRKRNEDYIFLSESDQKESNEKLGKFDKGPVGEDTAAAVKDFLTSSLHNLPADHIKQDDQSSTITETKYDLKQNQCSINLDKANESPVREDSASAVKDFLIDGPHNLPYDHIKQDHRSSTITKAKYESEQNKCSTPDGYVRDTFRISCRFRGKWKGSLNANRVSGLITENISERLGWVAENKHPFLDLYVNLTDDHFLIGASLTEHPLSLRPNAAHITLRSTVCSLLVNLVSPLIPYAVILDPMCGVASILVEADHINQNYVLIASDICSNQLRGARCNLRDAKYVNYLQANASSIPLLDNSVDAVVCDFPFGRKHKQIGGNANILESVVTECVRVSKRGSKMAFLLSSELKRNLESICKTSFPARLESCHPLSLGRLEAFACLLINTL